MCCLCFVRLAGTSKTAILLARGSSSSEKSIIISANLYHLKLATIKCLLPFSLLSYTRARVRTLTRDGWHGMGGIVYWGRPCPPLFVLLPIRQCGFNAETYRKIMGHILENVLLCLSFSMEKMWERYFQIGGGIILLFGAPVKSKFDGLKSWNSAFRYSLFFLSPDNSYLWI